MFSSNLTKFTCLRCIFQHTKTNKYGRNACRVFSSTSVSRKDNSDYNTYNSDFYDVVISGGGMVGTAMACAIGHQNEFQERKILLLEGSPNKGEFVLPENYSNRVCALSPGTIRLLQSFGAWDEIQNMRMQPVKRMQVWESCSESMITFDKNNLTDNLAYIVENDVILASINKQLPQTDNLRVMYSSKLTDFEVPDQTSLDTSPWVKLKLEDGRTIQTKLLIGADGFKSFVRQKSNIHSVQWDYKQSAVVATLELAETEDNNVAWQRFLPTGPIAILPLKANLSSLVWSTTPEDATNLLSLPEESFVDAINCVLFDESDKDEMSMAAGNILEQVLSSIIPGGTPGRQLPPTIIGVTGKSRAMFPLGLMHSSHYIKPRVALIGDAAHRIHPLAGQGVNLGFGDVECLRDVLVDTLRNGGDVGSFTRLSEYETARQRHVIPTMATIDGLQRLYSTTFTPMVMLRSLGLQVVNSLYPLKERLVAHATK